MIPTDDAPFDIRRFLAEHLTARAKSAALLPSSVATQSVDVVQKHLHAMFPYNPKGNPATPFATARDALTAVSLALADLREQGLIASTPTLLMDYLLDRDRFIFLMRKTRLRDPRAIEAVRAVNRGRRPFRAQKYQKTLAWVKDFLGLDTHSPDTTSHGIHR